MPERRGIAKRWLATHRELAEKEFLAVVDSLFAGDSHEEKTLAAILLGYCRDGRHAASPAHVDRWLEHVHGWAEVDSLCQNMFSPEELLADWRTWRALIARLARDPNINKRVIDDGPGIPPGKLSQLVNRGARGNEARTRVPEGQGLGLHIAYPALSLHGYSLTLKPGDPCGLGVEIEGETVAVG